MAFKDDKESATVYTVQSVEKLDDNVFCIHATARVRKVARINRNIIVLRHNKRQLTLISPVRLDEEGEAKLLQLGTPIRIIRLAPTQGVLHDRYYLRKFPQVRRWAPAESSDDDVPVHRLLLDEDDAILPACHVFCFQETAEPECALVLLQDYVGNLLVTSQALQAHRENQLINIPMRAKLASDGMMAGEAVIPPPWLKRVTHGSNHRKRLRADFERLLRLDFDRLVSSSGVMIYQGAKEKAVLAVERAFPVWEVMNKECMIE